MEFLFNIARIYGSEKMTTKDQHAFKSVLEVWKPTNNMPVNILQWFITEWCNYQCPYCPQTHGRYVSKGYRYTSHAFDNYPLVKWQDAFLRHFSDRRLSLVITGGEPLLDRKPMVSMLKMLTTLETLECVRIDTNASWNPKFYDEIDKSKIMLMCTFHPSQMSESSFFEQIDKILEHGFKIGMVNYVMCPDNFIKYENYKMQMETRGIPLHPNPLWDYKSIYSEKELDFLRQELPEIDYYYRTKIRSPKNHKCLFPALAYQVNYKGRVNVGCFYHISKKFFDSRLPKLFVGPVPCPHEYCVCLDQYSFIEGINRNLITNPLKSYSELLKKR